MIELRRPAPEDESAIRELSALSFNVPVRWMRGEGGPPIQLEHYLCAYDGRKLLATSRDIPMQQWFGGRALRTAGIASVATVPERRGTGLGDELMRALLRSSRERGAMVTSLYPATVPFYRRLGYEYGGVRTEYEVSLRSLPHGDAGVRVDEYTDDDANEIRECYRASVSAQTGPVEGEDDEWWGHRVLLTWYRDAATRAVVVRGDDSIEGYAAFAIETMGEGQGYRIDCTHLVATTQRAALALLGYFRRYQGVGRRLAWSGPPAEPLALLIGEETLRIRKQYRFMTRLLDVPGALEARGYPEVDGEVAIEIEDDLFEENRGPFRIRADAGKVVVERADGAAGVRLGVGLLSSMFAGFVAPSDAVRLGLLTADLAAVSFLSRLFAGAPPWMIDHF